MKIYTKNGDRGETSLVGKERISKADPRVDAYGAVDELNSCLGVVQAQGVSSDLAGALESIQRDLFAVGARLADPAARIAGRVSKVTITLAEVERLEQLIDRLEVELPPLRKFVLPGGSPAGAMLHLARTVCRRAERRVIALGEGAVQPVVVVYLNRLSDVLFVMARTVNHRAAAPEVEW